MSKLTILQAYIASRPNRFKSREQLEAYQDVMISKHLAYIQKTSPYFRKLIQTTSRKSLRNLPVMDKQLMMEHFNSMNTVGIDRTTAMELAINSEKSRKFGSKHKDISVGLSSGTSGHRGLFIVSDHEREQWAGTIISRFLQPRQLLGQRIAFFLRADNNLYETIGSKVLRFQYFDIYKNLMTNMAALSAFQPTILVAPPSMLTVIAEEIEAGRLKLDLQKVISVAEVLEPLDESRFKKVFSQRIIHQIYQCTEGFLAYTCPKGSLHLNEDIIHFEKEYIGERRFIPIITDFRRSSQPIIRYRLNDILLESNAACRCGSVMTVLERIEGREDDVFMFKNAKGNVVRVFSDMITRCMLYASGFNEFRVVQTDYGCLEIYLDRLTPAARSNIRQELDNLAEKLAFRPPRISYKTYKRDLTKKLKRIERVF